MDAYELGPKIGEGSYGIVRLARHKASGRRVVIKRVQLDGDPAMHALIMREVELLRLLVHENLITFRDSFAHKDKLFIVTDFCDGGDLDSRVADAQRKGYRFSEATILDIFRQVAEALNFLHTARILHRDIKNKNIFCLKPDPGGRERIRVGDFGLMRVLHSDSPMAETVVGTPNHLSPEICHGLPYNDKSDVWSLGVAMFELATLKKPFTGKSLYDLYENIKRGAFDKVALEETREIYSDELRHLIESMLTVEQRFRPSIEQLLQLDYVRGTAATDKEGPICVGPLRPRMSHQLRLATQEDHDGWHASIKHDAVGHLPEHIPDSPSSLSASPVTPMTPAPTALELAVSPLAPSAPTVVVSPAVTPARGALTAQDLPPIPLDTRRRAKSVSNTPRASPFASPATSPRGDGALGVDALLKGSPVRRRGSRPALDPLPKAVRKRRPASAPPLRSLPDIGPVEVRPAWVTPRKPVLAPIGKAGEDCA